MTSSRACFFIDGRDEFIGDYSPLIGMNEDMIQSSNVKVCLLSRSYRAFQDGLGHFSKLKLQNLHRAKSLSICHGPIV